MILNLQDCSCGVMNQIKGGPKPETQNMSQPKGTIPVFLPPSVSQPQDELSGFGE